jgi:hypothetical protein
MGGMEGGQAQGEDRATCGGIAGKKIASMLFHDASGDGQSQSCAFSGFFGGEERGKDSGENFRRQARPLIRHGDAYQRSFRMAGNF